MTDPHPTHLPPPWTPTGEAYFIICSKTVNNQSPGAYGLLEAKSDFANEETSGKFKGSILGGGIVQIIRYHTSPAGLYDELLYIPGWFEMPGGNKHWRTTNIYVVATGASQSTSQISHSHHTQDRKTTKSIHIKVSKPHIDGSSEPNPPFFSAICTPCRYIPSFPLNTNYIPFINFTFTHPPLPGSPEAYSEISTDQWRTVRMTMKGRMSITSVKPALDVEKDQDQDHAIAIEHGEFADGMHFPKFKPVAAVYLRGMELIVPEPIDEVTGKKETDV